MSVSQTEFRSGVFDPERAAPPGLGDGHGGRAGKRFDVYRNNVAVSLTEALKTAFPAVLSLVGDEFYTAMAGVFLRAHPPSSPLMMFYGSEMPGFLEGFPPVAHLPYLADVARLELGLRQAYHAADALPVAAQEMTPEALMALPMALAPAVQVVRSAYPLLSIYQRATGTTGAETATIAATGAVPGTGAVSREGPDIHAASGPLTASEPEDVLITRPGFDPRLSLLPPGGADFLNRLTPGITLDAALEGYDGDPTPILALLFQEAALTPDKGKGQ